MSDSAKSDRPERFAPPRRRARPSADSRRKLMAVLMVLVLSALGFCALVVWQRDVRLKTKAMDWATRTSAYLGDFYGKQGFLPARLPEELSASSQAGLDYPDAGELLRLSQDPGPYIVVARQRTGLITPGGDGCAAVIFDKGRFQARWIPIMKALAAVDRKRSLAG